MPLEVTYNMTSPTWANPKVKKPHNHPGQQACSHLSAPQGKLGSLPDMLLADVDSRIYQTKV